MKNYLVLFLFVLVMSPLTRGQTEDNSIVSRCMLSADPSAKYLKDFIIQLGEGGPGSEFRYKAILSLWKNTRYRFTMCTADDSKGQLMLTITDELDKKVLSSVDPKSGNVYNMVDFICNKSGIYHIYYDFTNGQSGSGVSIVSLLQ